MEAVNSGVSLPLGEATVATRGLKTAELADAFRSLDLDGDGRITRAELCSVLARLGLDTSQADVDSMVREADVDGDGCIDLDEFLRINAAAQRSDDVDDATLLREVFGVFDKDKNGFINAEELHTVLSPLSPPGEALSLEDCQSIIEGVDENGDGVVDFFEFQKNDVLNRFPAASGLPQCSLKGRYWLSWTTGTSKPYTTISTFSYPQAEQSILANMEPVA